MRVTERQAMCSAIFAVAAMGGTIHVSKETAESFAGYGSQVRKALVIDMHEAWERCSFIVERPFYGNNQHGWRLNRYVSGSGQRGVSRFMETAREFSNAMHAVESMHRELGEVKQ